MMTLTLQPAFEKAYRKRIATNSKLVKKVRERVSLFQKNPNNPLLLDHKLRGNLEGVRAFSITGDIRIIYHCVDDTHREFLDIGTHNQVYR